MTLPRRVAPGMIQMITRRVLRRTHLFRPDHKLRKLCLYLLALYSERYAIEIHAVVFMSTHEHLIVTDKEGRIPNFLRDFHRALALGTKVLRRWDGTLWDGEPTSRVELCSPQAIVQKLAYLMANPVDAGLVRHAEDWPGLTTLPHELGTATWTVERPDFFLDKDNPQWPPTATLRLTIPRVPWTPEEFRRLVTQELGVLEAEAQKRLAGERRRVLGRRAVLRSSPYEQATSWERVRSLNPHLAVGRGQKPSLIAAVKLLRAFRRAYRAALEQWREGVRDVLFPAATWQMGWLHAALVAPS